MRKCLIAIAVLAALGVRADEDSTRLEAKVDQLRTEVAQLLQLLAESMEMDRQQAATQAAAPRDAVRTSYSNGWYILSGPEGRLRLGGYGQLDARWFEQGDGGEDAFRIRRLRPTIAGDTPNDFAWQIRGDFAGSNAKLVDGWVEYTGWSWGAPRLGQYTEPFGLEALYSSANLDFLERSMISTAFAPMEDAGGGINGKLFGKRLRYGVGLFNGRATNLEENNSDKDVAGRVQWMPWLGDESPWLAGIAVGASATHGEQDDELTSTPYRSAGRVPFVQFADGVKSDGNRDRWGADVEWYVGPASLKAEWMQVEQDNIFAGSTNVDATFDGWAVTLTCLLTGEDKPRDRPLTDVGLGQGSWGAWELAFRIEEFNADDGLFQTGLALGTENARAYTAGLNWYPNGHVRVMLDGVHVDYEDALRLHGRTIDDEDVALLRWQFSL